MNRTKTTVCKFSLARIDQDTVREGSALSRTRLEAYKNIHRGVSQDRSYFRFGGLSFAFIETRRPVATAKTKCQQVAKFSEK